MTSTVLKPEDGAFFVQCPNLAPFPVPLHRSLLRRSGLGLSASFRKALRDGDRPSSGIILETVPRSLPVISMAAA